MGTLHRALRRRRPVATQNLWERQRLSRLWSGVLRQTTSARAEAVHKPVFVSAGSLFRDTRFNPTVGGDEIGTSYTTEPPRLYLSGGRSNNIYYRGIFNTTHTIMASRMNGLIFLPKNAFSKARMMQGCVEIWAFLFVCKIMWMMLVLFLMLFSHTYKQTNNL